MNHSRTIDEVSERVRATLTKIELDVLTGYTLADAIREGSAVSEQAYNWTGENNTVCALSAAEAAVRARQNIDR